MDTFDIFWLICKIAMALVMFIAMCLGIWFLISFFFHRHVKRTTKFRTDADRIQENREWLLSLNRVQLLMLTTEGDSGFDKQDKADLVHIADNVFSDREKQIILDRLAERLSHQFKY